MIVVEPDTIPKLHEEEANLDDDDLLSPESAAKFLSVKPKLLANWRAKADTPIRFVKLGAKIVRYRRQDLLDYLLRQTRG